MIPLPLQLRRSNTAHKRPAPSDLLEGEVVINYNSESSGLFFKDSSGSTVKIGPVAISADAPNSSPSGGSGNCEGELWYDPLSKTLKIFHEGEWVVAATPTPAGYTGEVTEGSTTFVIVDGIIADVVQA
jgi:hypothetical protein